jgi:hypothetical protein
MTVGKKGGVLSGRLTFRFGAHVAIGFSSGPYPATRYLTAEKPALILAASPGVGNSSNQRRPGALVSIPDAERLADPQKTVRSGFSSRRSAQRSQGRGRRERGR